MKKILYVLTAFVLLTMIVFFTSNNVMASTPLGTVEVQVSKEKITPGEEVILTVNFGTDLGAYTISADYDNAIFEYVSAEGGTPNNDGSNVKLVFYDSSGGSNTRNSATITFKAKESIVTSNPTNFAITLEGMANGDASVNYDDILVPIEKDVLVEPNYVDYALRLEYDGKIEADVQKEMNLITESSMGKNYDHVRMIAEVTAKPSDDATVRLLAKNEQDLELDLIQNGWGEVDGYALGGKDVKQELLLKGEFSQAGNYIVNIKIIDRDSSDAIVVQKSFLFEVNDKSVTNETPNTPTEGETSNTTQNTTEEMPDTLPKTGYTQYALILLIIGILAVGYIFTIRKKH